MPELRRYSRQGRAALWRAGLLHGVWVDLLARAGSNLVQFVNRFYRTPGFHHVVEASFGGPYRRRVARLAMRVANRLAQRDPNFARRLRFERVLGVGPRGMTVASLEVVHRETRYLLLAWRRLEPQAIGRLFRRTVALHRHPDSLRWVFDSSQLRQSKTSLVEAMRRHLRRTDRRGAPAPEERIWVDALDRIIRVF